MSTHTHTQNWYRECLRYVFKKLIFLPLDECRDSEPWCFIGDCKLAEVRKKCPRKCNTCPTFECKDLKPWCKNGDCREKLVVTQCPKKCGIIWCDYGDCKAARIHSLVRLRPLQSQSVRTQCPRKCGNCTTHLSSDNLSAFRQYFNEKNNNATTAQNETIICLLKVYKCLVSLDLSEY